MATKKQSIRRISRRSRPFPSFRSLVLYCLPIATFITLLGGLIYPLWRAATNVSNQLAVMQGTIELHGVQIGDVKQEVKQQGDATQKAILGLTERMARVETRLDAIEKLQAR